MNVLSVNLSGGDTSKMTINDKINEVLAVIQHINYYLNNNTKDSQYVDEWIDELKAEPISDERLKTDPITLTFSHAAVKEMIQNHFDK